MPAGSKYTPRQRHTPVRSQTRQSRQSTTTGKPDTVLAKTRKVIDKFATYIQKNQEAHRKHGVTPLDEDIEHYVGNFCNKTGDFGDENRREIRRSCRRDSDERIFEDLQGRRSAPRHTDRYTHRGEPVFEVESSRRPVSSRKAVRRPRERIIEIYEDGDR